MQKKILLEKRELNKDIYAFYIKHIIFVFKVVVYNGKIEINYCFKFYNLSVYGEQNIQNIKK